MNKKELTALIDCDILQYRCGFAADAQMRREAKDAEPDATPERIAEMLASTDYEAIALQNTKTTLEQITELFDGKHELYIHGKGNFRYALATVKPYKGNRDPTHKPKYAGSIKDYVIRQWDANVVNDIESDDALGTRQYNARDNTCIVSNDKDMDMIRGWHYNWVEDKLYYVTDEEADKMLLWQMLVGDTSDNIPGINKIGPKTATKLLSDVEFDEGLNRVCRLYDKEYGDKAPLMFHEISNLLWIRRHSTEECPFVYV